MAGFSYSLLFCLITCLTLFNLSRSDDDDTSEDTGWLVVGGEHVSPNEFPWMVRIYSDIPHTETFSCGANLISNEWMITAAHCVYTGSLRARSVRAYFGKHDLSTFQEHGEQYRLITDGGDIKVHPNYLPGFNTNFDYALIRLKEPIQLTGRVRPIHLPSDGICLTDSQYNETTREIDSCSVGIAAGWGRPQAGDSSTFRLKKVTLDIEPFETCRKAFKRDFFSTAKICARGELGHQTCRGDSGGPLSCPIRGRMYLIGITSYGTVSCDKVNRRKPAIYSRICTAMPWITEVIGTLAKPAAPATTTESTTTTPATTTTTKQRYRAIPIYRRRPTTRPTTKKPRLTTPRQRYRAVALTTTQQRYRAVRREPPATRRVSRFVVPRWPSSRGNGNRNNDLALASRSASPVGRRLPERPRYMPISASIRQHRASQSDSEGMFFFQPAVLDCSDANYVILQTMEGDQTECHLDHLDEKVKLDTLFNAIRGSFDSVVEALLHNGVDPNSVEHYAQPRPYSQPALILATRWNRIRVARILLDYGAELEAKDSLESRTAVNWAACEGYYDFADFLLLRGANIYNGCFCKNKGSCPDILAPYNRPKSSESKNNSSSKTGSNEQSESRSDRTIMSVGQTKVAATALVAISFFVAIMLN